MTKKAPVRLSALFADPEQVELRDGRIVDVAPISGLGFDLYNAMEEDPTNGALMWEITALCLPSLTKEDVKALRPAECAAVLAIATGRVNDVLELAKAIQGNVPAPTTAEPEVQSSSILSDSSAPESPAS